MTKQATVVTGTKNCYTVIKRVWNERPSQICYDHNFWTNLCSFVVGVKHLKNGIVLAVKDIKKQSTFLLATSSQVFGFRILVYGFWGFGIDTMLYGIKKQKLELELVLACEHVSSRHAR